MSKTTELTQKPLTMADIKEAARNYALLCETNEVKLAAVVTRKYQSEPRPRMKDGIPVHDRDGNPLFYDPRCEVTVAFTGGEKVIPVSLADYSRIDEGRRYMFKGRIGLVKSFGSETVDVSFSTIEEL